MDEMRRKEDKEEKESKFTKPSLKRELLDLVQQFIDEYPEYGFRSLAEFIEDAVRRRIDELRIRQLIPRFEHLNTFEDHVSIMDRKLGWDDEKGQRHPRLIDVYVRPISDSKFVFYCEFCGKSDCEHIKYVLSIRHKTVEPVERRGLKYAGPQFE